MDPGQTPENTVQISQLIDILSMLVCKFLFRATVITITSMPKKATVKIGFACKWIDFPEQVNGVKPTDDAKQYNTGTTTISWLNRQTHPEAEQRLWDLTVQNLSATRRLVERVGDLPVALRMVRLSSDILPVYTEPKWGKFYKKPQVVKYLSEKFAEVGAIARERGIKLSMHPGQFVVLASIDEGIVERSLEEFQYHVDMARYMGYGKQFQDMKINVHISGKQGPEGIRKIYPRLSPQARNTITIENEEMSWGLDDCLTISDIVPIVLDIHHHWVREGEYIDPTDPRVKQVIKSWRGVRPTMHYSVSREDCLIKHDPQVAPHYESLLKKGFNKSKLRAHSDFYWNEAVNNWAGLFLKNFDIMCESKAKNLASYKLYEAWKDKL